MIFLYIFGVIIAIFIILAIAAPKKYNVSRGITINIPKAAVYEYLKYIKNQDQWSPWQKRDPNMKKKFTGEDGEMGFVYWWDSDHKQVGSGEQEIALLQPNERVETDIRFLKPWKSESRGYFDLKDAANGGTELTWGFYGTNKVPLNIMMLFYNMDKAVGKDFEEGLSSLKTTLEN